MKNTIGTTAVVAVGITGNGGKMGDLQDELVNLIKDLKILQNQIWAAKLRNNDISPFSTAKFEECEFLLEKCVTNLLEVRTLEAVEQRYDPS